MFESLQFQLYHLSQFADRLVNEQLSHLNAVSIAIVFGAGLLTSLTPCMLSMLPIMVGYIGGYETTSRFQAAAQSAWFSLGLATTLAGLGLVATWVGQVYGQVGFGLPIIVSVIAILMGLNLLEALPFGLPSFGNLDWIREDLPKGVRSYCIGLMFGLVASPCSTPVLATLLAWISTIQNPVFGSGLLLAYTAGYSSPLIIAGTFTASLKKLLAFRAWSTWITPVSGVLLVSFGVYSLVTHLLPSV